MVVDRSVRAGESRSGALRLHRRGSHRHRGGPSRRERLGRRRFDHPSRRHGSRSPAQDEATTAFASNVMGTVNLFSAFGHPGQANVFASTAEVYGLPERARPLPEETEPHAMSWYAPARSPPRPTAGPSSATNRCMSRSSDSQCSTEPATRSSARYPNFVGSAFEHEPIRIFGGEELRDYLHVEMPLGRSSSPGSTGCPGLSTSVPGWRSRSATRPTPCSAWRVGAPRSSSTRDRNPRLISCSTSRGSARRPDSLRLAFFQTGWRSRLPAQRPPTLVFDLDGTLLDVSARNHHVYATVCTSLGGEPLPRDAYWHLKRQRTGWPAILAQSGLAETDVAAFEAKFVELIELPESLGFDVMFPRRSRCSPASRRHIAPRSCRSGHRRRRSARSSRCSPSPHSSTYRDEIPRWRPRLRQGSTYPQTVPADDPAVVIGDTEADIAAANALGYISIAVCSGIRDRDILELDHPGYVVDDIGGVEDALRRAKLL